MQNREAYIYPNTLLCIANSRPAQLKLAKHHFGNGSKQDASQLKAMPAS